MLSADAKSSRRGNYGNPSQRPVEAVGRANIGENTLKIGCLAKISLRNSNDAVTGLSHEAAS